MTWGAGGSTSDLTLEMCIKLKSAACGGMEPNMHLTCTNMEAAKITAALEGAKAAGIDNVVALRGGACAALRTPRDRSLRRTLRALAPAHPSFLFRP